MDSLDACCLTEIPSTVQLEGSACNILMSPLLFNFSWNVHLKFIYIQGDASYQKKWHELISIPGEITKRAPRDVERKKKRWQRSLNVLICLPIHKKYPTMTMWVLAEKRVKSEVISTTHDVGSDIRTKCNLNAPIYLFHSSMD
jgi:hypothetical protein